MKCDKRWLIFLLTMPRNVYLCTALAKEKNLFGELFASCLFLSSIFKD
ncbi:hypothetical protein EVA_15923 [gut metagenome]|uniref:Uncharacterized protein n=1 Tax=gut metagenome TaxID=749906 RepID=J9C7Y8_9ZZZZ